MAMVIARPCPRWVSGNPKGRLKGRLTLEQRKRAVLAKYRRDYPRVAARMLQLKMRMDLLEGQVSLTGDYTDKAMDEIRSEA